MKRNFKSQLQNIGWNHHYVKDKKNMTFLITEHGIVDTLG